MFRQLKRVRIKNKEKLIKVLLIFFGGWYIAGAFINSVANGISNTFEHTELPLLELNPLKNFTALFSGTGVGIAAFLIIMYCLVNKKGYAFITGYKTIMDKTRGIEILLEGTHGTSRWIQQNELSDAFETGSVKDIKTPLLGKLTDGSTAKKQNDFVGIKTRSGLNNNILVYGAPGSGKSRGFVKPFVLQAAERGESVILVDPKAEFFEAFYSYFKSRSYTVKAFNLLDKENSDGMNCFNDLERDTNLVQSIAEIIIKNTSNPNEKEDFWAKSEKKLLMALMHYVLTLKDKNGVLLPIEQRFLGAIYKLLSECNIATLDAKFKTLTLGHPALPPYGIFKQANPQILGNIIIGLGSRLNVFQDKLVDKITKYNDIDLELPGREKCAYFCIISDQDSSMEFMSSMFFSLLFVRLSDYARKYGNERRLPISVNVVLDEFCNIGKLLDFKKVLSTARSRGINIQIIIQSIAQLADRYPKMEYQEIIGNCDCQLFLGSNDQLTAEFISKQCGDMTVRINNSNVPMTPLFSPILATTKPYTHNKTSTGRPLMMPDEIRRLPDKESIVLMRGQKPLKLYKIIPEQHPSFSRLENVRISEYIPKWRKFEENLASAEQLPDASVKEFVKSVFDKDSKPRKENQTNKKDDYTAKDEILSNYRRKEKGGRVEVSTDNF